MLELLSEKDWMRKGLLACWRGLHLYLTLHLGLGIFVIQRSWFWLLEEVEVGVLMLLSGLFGEVVMSILSNMVRART